MSEPISGVLFTDLPGMFTAGLGSQDFMKMKRCSCRDSGSDWGSDCWMRGQLYSSEGILINKSHSGAHFRSALCSFLFSARVSLDAWFQCQADPEGIQGAGGYRCQAQWIFF